MEFRTLGRTGLRVSLMSLGSGGGSALGQKVGLSQNEQTALVRRALDLGVNFIDTSPHYFDSETILGKALKGVPRDSYLLTTKWLEVDEGKLVPDPQLLIDSTDRSLARLGTDHVDVMFFHGPLVDDYPTMVERLYPTMEQLRDEGKLRFIGISTRYAADPSQAGAEVALKTYPGLWDVVMLKYGILNQHAAKEMLPAAIKHGIGVMNMAALRFKLPDSEQLEELVAEWKDTGQVPSEALPSKDPLEWLLHDGVDSVVSAGYKFAADHPAVSTVITGTANIDHLEANAKALEVARLPTKDTRRLKELFGHIVEYA